MTAIRVIDEYTDAKAVAALSAADVYVKILGDTLEGNLDFAGNQAVDLLLELLVGAPSGSQGRVYFNSTTKKVFIYID